MNDLNTVLLATVLAINTLVLWSIGKMTWEVTRIANRIDEKTDRILRTSETSLEALIELFARTKKA
jgi:hypothetical protein